MLPRIRLVFATRPYRRIIDDHSRRRSLATALCGARFASGLATPSYTITRDTTPAHASSRDGTQVVCDVNLGSVDVGRFVRESVLAIRYTARDTCRYHGLQFDASGKSLAGRAPSAVRFRHSCAFMVTKRADRVTMTDEHLSCWKTLRCKRLPGHLPHRSRVADGLQADMLPTVATLTCLFVWGL